MKEADGILDKNVGFIPSISRFDIWDLEYRDYLLNTMKQLY